MATVKTKRIVQSLRRIDTSCLVEVEFNEQKRWFCCDNNSDPTDDVMRFIEANAECCVKHMVGGYDLTPCVGKNENYQGPGMVECYLSVDRTMKAMAIDIRRKPDYVKGV